MAGTSESILAVRNLSVEFDGFYAVRDVSLDVRRGSLHCLIGPNGAGKTTLLDAICGRVRPTRGQVWLEGTGGRNLAGLSEHRIARLGVGRKFQTPSVFPALTVRENLELAASRPTVGGSLLSRLRPAAARRIQDTIELIGMHGQADRTAGELAHGAKQWLEMGLLLVREPDLLLLDEPVAGMTAGERARTGELLQRVAGRHTVLLVEHDMHFVRRIATRVTVLHLGQVLVEGSMEKVAADPRVVACYLGRAREEGAVAVAAH